MIPAISQTGVTVLLENIFWDVGGKSYDATCANPDEAAGLIDRLNELAGFEAFSDFNKLYRLGTEGRRL